MINTSGFQMHCADWHDEAFPDFDLKERPVKRGALHLEEATELAQAIGLTEDKAIEIVRSVFAKPVGKPRQEIGGSYITLLLLAECLGEDAGIAGADELQSAYERIPEIRRKSALKVAVDG